MKASLSATRAELQALAVLVPALAPHAELVKRVRSVNIPPSTLVYDNPEGEPLTLEVAVSVEE